VILSRPVPRSPGRADLRVASAGVPLFAAALGLCACGGYRAHAVADAGGGEPDAGTTPDAGEVGVDAGCACDECPRACTEVAFGHEPGETPFDPERGSCVASTPEGDLVIDMPRFLHPAWFADADDGTVSLFDSIRRTPLARFRSGPLDAADAPGRTALGYWSDVYVANRAPGAQSSVTRIRGYDCADADEDGVVRTSTGLDDVLAFGDDECVDWNSPVGGVGAEAAALVLVIEIGLDGAIESSAWVGLAGERRWVAHDAETGEALGTEVDVAPCVPDAAASSSDGEIWSTCAGSADLVRIDVEDPGATEILTRPGPEPVLGVAVDHMGRVWTAGPVSRYEPWTDEWASAEGTFGVGLTVGLDDVGIAGCTAPEGTGTGTCVIQEDDLEVEWLDVASVAIDADSESLLWAVRPDGGVDLLEGWSGDRVGTILDDRAAGERPTAHPYSDFVEAHLHNAILITCDWTAVVAGCPDGLATTWRSVEWVADLPGAAWIEIEVRTADTEGALEGVRFSPIAIAPRDAPPIDLAPVLGDAARAPWLEVHLELGPVGHHGPRPEDTPVVHALRLRRDCG